MNIYWVFITVSHLACAGFALRPHKTQHCDGSTAAVVTLLTVSFLVVVALTYRRNKNVETKLNRALFLAKTAHSCHKHQIFEDLTLLCDDSTFVDHGVVHVPKTFERLEESYKPLFETNGLRYDVVVDVPPSLGLPSSEVEFVKALLEVTVDALRHKHHLTLTVTEAQGYAYFDFGDAPVPAHLRRMGERTGTSVVRVKSNASPAKRTNSVLKVLVADDDPLVRRVLSLKVRKHSTDVRVFEATDGVEALDLIRKNGNMDIIMSDVCMPSLDGPSFVLMGKRNGRIDTLMSTIVFFSEKSFTDKIQNGLQGKFVVSKGKITQKFIGDVFDKHLAKLETLRGEALENDSTTSDFFRNMSAVYDAQGIVKLVEMLQSIKNFMEDEEKQEEAFSLGKKMAQVIGAKSLEKACAESLPTETKECLDDLTQRAVYKLHEGQGTSFV